MTVPDFSPFASDYARSRPRYPAALFTELASLAGGNDLAWDCATGNGQAAIGLAGHFRRVVATDHSREQLDQAPPHPRIDYQVAPAERSGLDDGSVDLVTVAAAVHWFDLEAFFDEVRRVARPGGVLAVWTYHVGHVEPPFDKILERLYFEVLRPYFAPQVELVDALYETIPMSGRPLATSDHRTDAEWNLEQMLRFIASWSGTRRYAQERGEDPVGLVAEELRRIWGPPETVHRVRWPLFLRACRLP